MSYRIKWRVDEATKRANLLAEIHDDRTTLDALPELIRLVVKSSIPEGGWTAENTSGRAGRKLQRDLIKLQRLVRAKAYKAYAPVLQKYMVGQVERVIAQALTAYRRIYGVRAPDSHNFPQSPHVLLWSQAIQEEIGEGSELVLATGPITESVGLRLYENIGIVFGKDPTPQQLGSLKVRVGETARQVTRINETTRNLLAAKVRLSVSRGETVFETAEWIRNNMPQIATNRVPTITRTEMGRVQDTAVKVAMRDSKVVSHITVMGCEAIERDGPHFQGFPTCNIRNVPIGYERELVFHPNHTGMIVASGYYHQDGRTPNLPLGGGPYSD